MQKIIAALIFLTPLISLSQENPGCYVRKDFLLIRSSKSYSAALETAKQAARVFQIRLDLRGLIPGNDKSMGLSMPADSCLAYSRAEYGESTDGDSSCYLARGRWDDGIYISIEYSNAYSGFAEGYYIVMAGNADKKDATLAATLVKLKTKFPDAYIKESRVYLCCMH